MTAADDTRLGRMVWASIGCILGLGAGWVFLPVFGSVFGDDLESPLVAVNMTVVAILFNILGPALA